MLKYRVPHRFQRMGITVCVHKPVEVTGLFANCHDFSLHHQPAVTQ